MVVEDGGERVGDGGQKRAVGRVAQAAQQPRGPFDIGKEERDRAALIGVRPRGVVEFRCGSEMRDTGPCSMAASYSISEAILLSSRTQGLLETA